MRSTKFSKIFLFCSLSFFFSNANALVADFEDVAVASGTITGAGAINGDVVSGGLLFDLGLDHHHLGNDVVTFNGTTWLAVDDYDGTGYNGDGSLTMSVFGGGLFDLASIDFAEFDLNPATVIEVTGSGGEFASIVLDGIMNGINDFQNELFGWTNLSWVNFNATGEGILTNGWALDNINYELASVPAPASLALLGLGLLGLGATRRKAL